jgi:heterogeneous nuclear ribonucleoprotein A1/A3
MNKRKLYIGNLSYCIDTPDLCQLFIPYGAIKDVVVIKEKETGHLRGFGFVTFAEEDQAVSAVIGMQGRKIQGRLLRIKFADNMHRRTDLTLCELAMMNEDLIIVRSI